MRFGQLRGVTLTAAFLGALVTVQIAAADGIIKTIPREVLAQDLNTGQPYFAPPIPWGHYAKDGPFDHYYPKAGHLGFLHHGCKGCGGSGLLGNKACGGCGGSGLLGNKAAGGCGGLGCGLGSKCGLGHGLFSKCGNGTDGCGDPGCGLGHGSGKRIKDCGLCKNKGCGLCQSSVMGDPMYVTASAQTPVSSPILPVASSQGVLGAPAMLCDGCVGKGCGKCNGCGLLHRGSSDSCGGCGLKGCGGKCGPFGRGNGFGNGGGCGLCGGKGCGSCGLGNNGGGCRNCGGRGCGLCSGLKSKLAGLLHHKSGNIKYFVGPGGPVPLTPGYVPYTVTTRSPRDFLAFPPYTPSAF